MRRLLFMLALVLGCAVHAAAAQLLPGDTLRVRVLDAPSWIYGELAPSPTPGLLVLRRGPDIMQIHTNRITQVDRWQRRGVMETLSKGIVAGAVTGVLVYLLQPAPQRTGHWATYELLGGTAGAGVAVLSLAISRGQWHVVLSR